MNPSNRPKIKDSPIFLPIQQSNGVFSKTMSRFVLVIQRSNRGFHTYIKPGQSEIHPTGQKKTLNHFFDPSNHPTGFSTHMSDLTSSESIQQAKNKRLSRFFLPIQQSNGVFSKTMSLFFGHPTIQQGIPNIYQTWPV